jgi:hypothetical protein
MAVPAEMAAARAGADPAVIQVPEAPALRAARQVMAVPAEMAAQAAPAALAAMAREAASTCPPARSPWHLSRSRVTKRWEGRAEQVEQAASVE